MIDCGFNFLSHVIKIIINLYNAYLTKEHKDYFV